MPNVVLLQSNVGTMSVAGSAFPVTFTGAQSGGNINLVFTYCNTPVARFIHSITDTAGNTTRNVGYVQDATQHQLMCWAALNTNPAPAGNIVTANMPNYPNLVMMIAEYNGADGNYPIDTWSFNSGTVGPATCPITLANDGETLVAFVHENAVTTMVPVAPLVVRRTSTTLQLNDGVYILAGAQTATSTVSTGQWVMITVALNPMGVNLASTIPFTKGEVLYNGPQLGTVGQDTNSTTKAALLDAEGTTPWSTAVNSSWAGVDAGTRTRIRRIRITPKGGREDSCIRCQVQGSNDPTFLSGNILFVVPQGTRPTSGTLMQEYLIDAPANVPYRYYRWFANNLTMSLADLDFIGLYTSGVLAQAVQPVIDTPAGGGVFYSPIRTTVSCLTDDVSIYYSLDGSIPSVGSLLYTRPIVISQSAIFNMVAVSPSLSDSRVSTSYFYLNGPQFNSGTTRLDNRNYRLTSRSGCFFRDPISGYWYEYKEDLDTSGYRTSGYQGFNVYRSADLMNWDYAGNICGPDPGLATNNIAYLFRPFVYYNAQSQLYVLWCTPSNGTTGIHVCTSPYPDGRALWSTVATYTASLGGLNGPFGDLGGFIDDDNTPYLIYTYANNTRVCYARLTADYLNVDVNFSANYSTGGEAWTIFRRHGIYFSIASGQAGNNYSTTSYQTSNTPIGPWSGGINPFTVVSGVGPVSPGNSYQSQTDNVLRFPGRGDCFIYCGDRIQAPLGFTNESRATKIFIPMVFSDDHHFTLTWREGTWLDHTTFSSPFFVDALYPSLSGAPLAPSNLTISPSNATWINNEPYAHNLYFEGADDIDFGLNVISDKVPAGASQFAIMPSQSFFRLRAVNVSGTSFSNTVITQALQDQILFNAIVQNLDPPLPESLEQILYLKDLPPEEQRAAWNVVLENFRNYEVQGYQVRNTAFSQGFEPVPPLIRQHDDPQTIHDQGHDL